MKNGNFAAVLLVLGMKLASQETCCAADLPGLLVMERQAQGARFCFWFARLLSEKWFVLNSLFASGTQNLKSCSITT